MNDDILKEIRAVKETLTFLTERIRQLEQRATTSLSGVVSVQAPKPLAPSAPVPQRPVVAAPKAGRENLELKIGRYWLNRMGIFSLVMGVAFFILYSFQYLGSVAKISIGFAVGLALLGTGVWLERKAGMAWYARGLVGGGWATIYFTTYAMYHIAAVQILQSAALDLLLLLLVAICAVRHALAYRSEVITALAFTLGFITTSISDITYFTLASSALLVISLVLVAVRMRWHGLCLYGVLGSYLTQLLWIGQQIAQGPIIAVHADNVAIKQFWLTAGFLGLYWVVYTIATLLLDERDVKSRNALLTTTLANGLFFITQFLRAMEPAYEHVRYLVLLGVGALYMGLDVVAKRRGQPATSTVYQLLGLTFMTLAIPEHLTGRWTSFLWTMEVASLAWLGLHHNRWTYRVFAFGLGVLVFGRLLIVDLPVTTALLVLGRPTPWRLLIGIVGVGSFAISAVCYWLKRYRPNQRQIEWLAFYLYVGAASIVAATLTFLEGRREFISCFWAMEASTLVLIGWDLKDRILRMFGAVWFGLVSLGVLVEIMMRFSWWSTPATSGIIGLLYAMSALYRSGLPGNTFSIERSLRHVYSVTASLILLALLWVKVSSHWLSLAWAAEGLALVVSGFVLRDRILRITGLGVFAVLVLRVLFVDMAGVETIYRIVSFVVVGAILLAASLAYARFSTVTPKSQK